MKGLNFSTGFICLLLTSGMVFSQQPGALDISFNPGAGANNGVWSIALSTNGQILIGGWFTLVNGQSRNYIARLNSDGSLDDEFLPLQGADAAVYAIAPNADGTIYIGGSFGSYNGIPRGSLARLRNDASLDLSWPSISINGYVSSLRSQSDGTLLVQGTFTQIGTAARYNLARLNSDASVDPSFRPSSAISDGSVSAYAIQPDGQVIIAGTFTTNSPVSRQCIARVSQSGSLDSSFNAGLIAGGGPTAVQAVALQTDGKVIVAGAFSSINGYSRIGIARLNTNGTMDTSFVLASGLANNANVSSVSVLPNGKVLLAGSFSVSGINSLVQLNTDGSFDSTFNAQANQSMNVALIHPDGKLLVGGYFTSIGGTNLNRIARLKGTNTNIPTVQLLNFAAYPGMFLSGTVSNNYRLEWTSSLNTPSLWTPLFDMTLQTNPQLIFDPTPITGKQRFYRAVALQ